MAENLRRAATLLRSESYLAVVLDQYLLETEPDEIDTAMQHLGTAIPVQVNLAISGLDRLVREVRAAVERRKREEAAARQAAVGALHSELNGTLTALLLECELALRVPGLPATVTEKLTVRPRTGKEDSHPARNRVARTLPSAYDPGESMAVRL